MQIVIAGASGFIGSEVVARALDMGHQVFTLLRDQSPTPFDTEAMNEGRLVCLPLGADPEILAQGFGLEPGARWILAAGLNRGRDPLVLGRAHVSLTQDLVSSAEALEAERVVLLSCLGAGLEGHWAASKRAAEGVVRGSSRPWIVVRSAPVYGIGDALLDEVGAWMHRSPFIPRFLEEVELQPLHVGDVAEALLISVEGDLQIGGDRLSWGDLLQACAQAAGKSLMGPQLSLATQSWLARTFGDRGWLADLVPFDTEAWLRHREGYTLESNALPRLLGRDPRPLGDYLQLEWAYRAK